MVGASAARARFHGPRSRDEGLLIIGCRSTGFTMGCGVWLIKVIGVQARLRISCDDIRLFSAGWVAPVQF